MSLFDDAPLIDFDDHADGQDVYAFIADPESQGSNETLDIVTFQMTLDEQPGTGQMPTSDVSKSFTGAEDVFVFFTANPGPQSSKPSDGTEPEPPAKTPEEIRLEELLERERNPGRNDPRHSATGAMLMRILLGG